MAIPPEFIDVASSMAGYHLSRSMKWLEIIGATVAAAHVSSAIDSAYKLINLDLSEMDEDNLGIFADTDALIERMFYSFPS